MIYLLGASLVGFVGLALLGLAVSDIVSSTGDLRSTPPRCSSAPD